MREEWGLGGVRERGMCMCGYVKEIEGDKFENVTWQGHVLGSANAI